MSQRRVKFPTDFDALELCTPELRDKLLPLSRRLKELEKQNATLKRLLAEAELEKAALKELAEGNF